MSLDLRYLALSMSAQRPVSPVKIFQTYLAMRHRFMSLVSMIPKPPKALGLHTASQRTQWYLRFFPFASQKKRERCPSIVR